MSKDILLVVDSLANERGVKREIIFDAISSALVSVTQRRYLPKEVTVSVVVDRATGDYETFIQKVVVDNSENDINTDKEMTLDDARAINSTLQIGDIIEEQVASVPFGRIAAQHAKQFILRELRRVERLKFADNYAEKIGRLVVGTVKYVSREQIILDVGDSVEASIQRKHLLPKDAPRIGDRIKALLLDIKKEGKGPLLVLSRVHSGMVRELFKLEVPEINEDIIEIKGVARDPGVRAKVAVKTNDGRIDPIGACIGMRGSRVQTVSNELNSEKMDIVLWSDDPAQLLVNTVAPIKMSSIVVDEDKHSMDIAVKKDDLAQVIGRGGKNIQLISKLVGWELNVMTEEESQNKNQSNDSFVSLFVENLNIDKEFADLLVKEGFRTLESIAYSSHGDLSNIENLDESLEDELRDRAKNALLSRVLSEDGDFGTVEPAVDLLELEGMTRHLAYIFASRGIVSREDLAECSIDELDDVKDLTKDQAAILIMKAREHWFK